MTAALVFLHGGCHSSTSWSATIAALTAQQPGMRAIAVDLPGRGGVAGELESLTLETCGASVAAQIDQQLGPRRPVVLVGHSLAGVVIPRRWPVSKKTGSAR